MEHYDRRDTFQSENSGAGGVYDNHNYDPYGSYFLLIFPSGFLFLVFRITMSVVRSHRLL
jgi:hypothetical protein